MKNIFELHLRISPPDESQLETLEQKIDFLYSAHGTFHALTCWSSGDDALSAAQRTYELLSSHGLVTLYAFEDLVTRQEIAERLSVSRQAVSNWIRKVRRGPNNLPFPTPSNPAGGGLWSWKDINEWASSMPGTDEKIRHLGLKDVAQLNAWIVSSEQKQHVA